MMLSHEDNDNNSSGIITANGTDKWHCYVKVMHLQSQTRMHFRRKEEEES